MSGPALNLNIDQDTLKALYPAIHGMMMQGFAPSSPQAAPGQAPETQAPSQPQPGAMAAAMAAQPPSSPSPAPDSTASALYSSNALEPPKPADPMQAWKAAGSPGVPGPPPVTPSTKHPGWLTFGNALQSVGSGLLHQPDEGAAAVNRRAEQQFEQRKAQADYQSQLPVLQQEAAGRFGQQQAQAATTAHTQAETTAQTAETPADIALKEAQAAAAKYKEVGGVLYDVSGQGTPQPVQGAGQFTALDPNLASMAGLQPGTKVPLETAIKLKQLSDAGIKNVQAGGRSLLVDSTGKTIKDLGASTPVVVNTLQNALPAGQNGQPSAMAQAVANGQMKWQDVISPRTPISVKEKFAQEVKALNPDFNTQTYEISKKVAENFTSGDFAKQLNAISTARNHMQTFSQLATALENGDVQAANQIGNAYNVQFGSDKATNFRIASQAFGGEVGKAFDGAGVTQSERESASQAFNPNMSPQQFRGAVQTVDTLLQGKQKALQQTYEQGKKGQPNFGAAGAQQHTPGAQANLPEGTTGKGSDNKPYIVKGGVWVPQ